MTLQDIRVGQIYQVVDGSHRYRVTDVDGDRIELLVTTQSCVSRFHVLADSLRSCYRLVQDAPTPKIGQIWRYGNSPDGATHKITSVHHSENVVHACDTRWKHTGDVVVTMPVFITTYTLVRDVEELIPDVAGGQVWSMGNVQFVVQPMPYLETRSKGAPWLLFNMSNSQQEKIVTAQWIHENMAFVKSAEPPKPKRPSWDKYFGDMAKVAATRSTCPRASVGCVLVRDKHAIVTGFNGSVSGAPHCTDVGCDLVNNGCARVVHAEANAIATAAKLGHAISGSTAYVSMMPCRNCFQLLANAKICRIVYSEIYRDTWVLEAASRVGISIVQTPAS